MVRFRCMANAHDSYLVRLPRSLPAAEKSAVQRRQALQLYKCQQRGWGHSDCDSQHCHHLYQTLQTSSKAGLADAFQGPSMLQGHETLKVCDLHTYRESSHTHVVNSRFRAVGASATHTSIAANLSAQATLPVLFRCFANSAWKVSCDSSCSHRRRPSNMVQLHLTCSSGVNGRGISPAVRSYQGWLTRQQPWAKGHGEAAELPVAQLCLLAHQTCKRGSARVMKCSLKSPWWH